MEGKVAPHLNCEVRLVLGGHKPLASIELAKDSIGYALAISLHSTGALLLDQVQDGEVIIVKPSNIHLLFEYKALLCSGVSDYGLKEYHRKMGRLYGYREEDIEAFITSEINCNCNKCTGRGEYYV